jgi:high-affinity K+ transport system ATPase subunit B
VGELGRERFTPMVPGVITRNSELRGSGQTIMHIDARGTDPALTQANVARALQATRQQARQEGAMLALEINRRRPR